MLPGDFQTVGAILLAVAPGFIATTVWARARTWKGAPADVRLILQSVALSALVQLAAAPLTILLIHPMRDDLAEHPARLAIWLSIVVLVLPVFGGLVLARVSDRLFGPDARHVPRWIAQAVAWVWKTAPPPTIWDWLFTARPPHRTFLVIEFNDGRRVASVFADGSLALTSPESQGIYLSSEWIVDEDGDVIAPVRDSDGIMVRDLSGVRSVRLLRGDQE